MMFGLLEHPDIAAALCTAYNDWLARYCATDAQRLIGVALLPQHDPHLAAAELERAVTTYGFVGGVMRPNRVGGRTVDHPDFDVLWGTAEQLDVPVSLHEAYLVGHRHHRSRPDVQLRRLPHRQPRLRADGRDGQRHVGWDLPTLPTTRVGFLEAGCGWAPTWTDRIEEHYELAPGDYRGGNPDGALNTRSWLTFEIEEPGLASTLDKGGPTT